MRWMIIPLAGLAVAPAAAQQQAPAPGIAVVNTVPPTVPVPPQSPPAGGVRSTAIDAVGLMDGNAPKAQSLHDPQSYVSPDDYPAAAGGMHGKVRVTLDVGPDGRVSACLVEPPSPSPALDAATCRILRFRARYIPGRDKSGKPAQLSVIEQEVHW